MTTDPYCLTVMQIQDQIEDQSEMSFPFVVLI